MKRVWVRDELRRLIDTSPPGALIPSERELSDQLGVSRPTLRAAIEDLAGAGLLVRHQGRGTFTRVRPTSSRVPDPGWPSRVEEFRVEAAGARLGARLEISPATPALTVRRVRISDDHPIAIERISLPAALVPGLEPAVFETGPFHEVLRERYDVSVTTAVQTTEATVTDDGESGLLAVPVHAPALLIERTSKDAGGRVVEYTRSIYRGDRYRVTAQLTFP
ncbi:GntR family transcriptional regulator [Kineosporia succinea]|nr:GntR family transcriptional regulator [Kineosporia succinea]